MSRLHLLLKKKNMPSTDHFSLYENKNHQNKHNFKGMTMTTTVCRIHPILYHGGCRHFNNASKRHGTNQVKLCHFIVFRENVIKIYVIKMKKTIDSHHNIHIYIGINKW